MHPAPAALIGEVRMGTMSKVHPKEKQTNQSRHKAPLLCDERGCPARCGPGPAGGSGRCGMRDAGRSLPARSAVESAPGCPRRPIDASLGRIVFCPCNLENSPLITCEEVGDPAPPAAPLPRWPQCRGHPRPLAADGAGVGEEIRDPEVRGQGSSPDYRSIEEVSDSQAST